MKAGTYDEFLALPKAVRDHVLDKNRDWNVEHYEWWDCVYEQFKEDMYAKGISVDRMQFSGFWSQGDGASFNGGIHDLSLFVKSHERLAEFEELAKYDEAGDVDIRASWESRSNYYCHSNTLHYSFDNGLTEPYEHDYDSALRYQIQYRLHEDLMKLIESFEEAVEPVIKDHCDDLYRSLEEAHDCLTDEPIIESMLANDALQEAIDEAVEALGPEDEQQAA